VDRAFHDDAGNIKYHGTGYWIVNMDQNSPRTVKSLIPEMAYMQPVDLDCVHQVYCGMPYLMPALSFIWYVEAVNRGTVLIFVFIYEMSVFLKLLNHTTVTCHPKEETAEPERRPLLGNGSLATDTHMQQ
jgi:hypothetical protein